MTFVCVSTTSLCCLQDVRAATTKARADLTGAFASKRPQGAAKTAAAGAGDGDGGVDMDFGDDYEGEKESKATRAGSKLDAVFDDGGVLGRQRRRRRHRQAHGSQAGVPAEPAARQAARSQSAGERRGGWWRWWCGWAG